MLARARWLALGLAALAAMFWLGTRVSAPAGERVIVERPVAAAPAAAPAVVRAVAGAPGLTRDDIRAVVREELAQHAAEAAPAAEPASPERTARVQAAVAAAHDAVTAGISRGVWGDRERAALRVQLVQLGPAETQEVLTPLFQAINAQRLQLDGPPI